MERSKGFFKFRLEDRVPAESADQDSKPKRASIACDNCRMKKKRCDQQYPRCGACSRSQAQCNFTNRIQPSPYPLDHVRALETRLRWLEHTVQEVTGLEVAQVPTGTRIAGEQEQRGSDGGEGWWYPGPYAIGPSDGLLPDVSQRNSPPHSEGLSEVNEVFCKSIDHRTLTRELPPRSCDAILLSSFEDAETRTDQYFDSLGYQYPFLERPIFWENLQQLYDGHVVDDDFHYFYHITVAISMLIGSDDKSEPERFYRASRTSLPHVLRREDLTALRALLSLVLYSLFSTSGPSVWHTLGACMRLVTSMGLQKCKKKAETEAEMKKNECEKRCFWSVYTLDRLISITFGRPLGLADEDITVELPGEYNEQWVEAKKACSMSIPLHAIKLRRICSKIYQILYREPQVLDPHVADISVNETILTFRHDLDAWRISAPVLPFALHYSTTYFDYLYYATLILLYHPNNLNPFPNATCIVSCGDASVQVIRAFYDAYTSDQIKWIPLTFCQIYAAGLTLLWGIEQVVKASSSSSSYNSKALPWSVPLSTLHYGIDAANTMMSEFSSTRNRNLHNNNNKNQKQDRPSPPTVIDRLAMKFHTQSKIVLEKAKMVPGAFEINDSSRGVVVTSTDTTGTDTTTNSSSRDSSSNNRRRRRSDNDDDDDQEFQFSLLMGWFDDEEEVGGGGGNGMYVL